MPKITSCMEQPVTHPEAPWPPLREGRVLATLENGMALLFDRRPGRAAALFRAAWLMGLYLAGVYLWGVFFSWGNIRFDFLDWVEVTGPRYAILRDAALKNQFPLHAANPAGLRGVTDRYLAIADTPLSPQFYLLRWIEPERYVFVDVLLFYTLGFLGLLLLYRRYRLSVGVFTVLFLLFHFNGNISAHLAVGHSLWTGHFLIPFFVYLGLLLAERGGAGWRWIAGVVAVLVGILLQGYFHLYVWGLMFLGLLALFSPRLLKPALLAALFAVLVALPRLLPPALVLDEITPEYLGGFASLTDLLSGMAVLRDPDRAVGGVLPSMIFPLNAWETDYYIGLLGTALVLGLGIWAPLKAWKRAGEGAWMGRILWPCFALVILSLGDAFQTLVKLLPIPPLTGERVTARILILPLAFFMALAAICWQRALDGAANRRPRGRLDLWESAGMVGLGLVFFHDLNRHLAAWRIRYLDGLVYLFPKVPFDPAQHGLNNHPDPQYTGLLLAGLVVTLAAVAWLTWKAVRERA